MPELHMQASDTRAAGAGSEAYDSFAALRRAHVELRRSWSEGTAAAKDVRRFVARAVNTGALLEDDNDRRGAQGILDYWCAELVTLTAEKPLPSDYIPAVLVPFDARQAAASPGAPSLSGATTNRRSREIIRFVAAARLWQDSGKKSGYLLYGDAIVQAARYRDVDPDIAELVNASEAKRDSTRMKVTYAAAAAVAAIVAMIAFETVVVDKISKWLVAQVQSSGTARSTKVFYLRTLDFLHRWQPPYDLSSSDLENVSARNLRLYSPNFSSARLRQVDFQGAQFANATFSGGEIFGNFRKADLSRAQFRTAQIESTSFAEATLYRATFNRACLNNVDFSGADLRLASFWGATFDKNQRSFKNTAWWLAEGWHSDDLRDLLQQDQSKLNESAAFKENLKDFSEAVRIAEAGAIQRSRDLNSLAWLIASWGLVNNVTTGPTGGTEQACTSATGLPGNALEAAQQAVCIATSLRDKDVTANNVAANNSDTLAYILMQMPDRMVEALNIYQKLPLSDDERGARIFRAAVAQYTIGDKSKALSELKRAMQEHYVPSHELQTLKAHIKDEFQTVLYAYLDAVWPRPEGAKPCQFGSDAVNP
jgi:uncharacterized protein YjbI with pentapeptide repeats